MMYVMPLISICVPAYKRLDYLERLLNSIAGQTFRDFEVIISDDSPDESVEQLIVPYRAQFPISYFRNVPSLGTPGNWNFGISKATGEWIKLIHDDDWFATPESLAVFAAQTGKGPRFIFSAYSNCYSDGKKPDQPVYFWKSWRKRIVEEPVTLLAYNVVGPPSVTLVHRSIAEQYDERMKWRVDMDFYVRLLQQEKVYTCINQLLINVGVSETQVTNVCFENPLVELPEGLLLLQKYGTRPLRNIWVYDAWWRLLRNMDIRNAEQLSCYAPGEWPKGIVAMVKHLDRVPASLLKMGVCSKVLMSVSYLLNLSKSNV